MPYYDNTPQANQRISASQPQIQSNFLAIEQALGDDHVTFNTGAAVDWGKHNVIHFEDQGAAIPPLPGATEITLYNQVPPNVIGNVFPLTGFHELILRINDGRALWVPITAKSAYATPAVLGNSNWFYLPCGWVVKYGVIATAVVGPDFTANINLDAIGTAPIFAQQYVTAPYAWAVPSLAASLPQITVSVAPTAHALSIFTNIAANVYWFTIGPVA